MQISKPTGIVNPFFIFANNMSREPFDEIFKKAVAEKVIPEPTSGAEVSKAVHMQLFSTWLNEKFEGSASFDSVCTYENFIEFRDTEEVKYSLPRETTDKIVKQFSDLGIDGRIDIVLMFHADSKYKSKITVEQTSILAYIFSTYYPRLEKGGKDGREPDLGEETLNIMLEEELITSQMEGSPFFEYVPTAKGYRINEQGGYLKFKVKENKKEQDAIADRALTRAVGKASKLTNRVQLVSIALTIIIIGYGAWLQTKNFDLTKENNELNKLQRDQNMFQQQQVNQLHYYQMQVDSLSHQVNLLNAILKNTLPPKKSKTIAKR